jgi:ketosteroid isomerase-like protein
VQRVAALISYVEQGRIVAAIREFYGENIVSRENLNPPTIGKAANLEREAGFEAYVDHWQRAHARTVLVDGDRVVINWDLEYTSTDGKRWHYDELALQRWENGQIVEERFVYDSASVAVA